MASTEEALDMIITKADNYLATEPTNKYLHGFDVSLVADNPEEVVEKFNKGDVGKITVVTIDDGITYFSWAPTQSDLDFRERQR